MKEAKTKLAAMAMGSRFRFAICIFLLSVNCLFPVISNAQSLQVQNSIMYLKEKKLDKAKLNADAAVESDKTKGLAKAWLYRGKVYQAIYQDTSILVNQLDPDSKEKAVESFVKCVQLDKDKIYKEDTKLGVSVSAASLLNKVETVYMPGKQFDKALAACELLKTTLPYDQDDLLKRRNVTAENLMHIQYKAYYSSNDIVKAKETGDKLIAANFKMPAIYSSMAKLSLAKQDTAAALSYLDKGLAIFDDNMDLLNIQIHLLTLQKNNELLKQKLESALEINPSSDVLHTALGSLYERTNNIEKAEQEYIKAIESNPKNDNAQNSLGVIYINQGDEWNKKMKDVPAKETVKMKEFETKRNEHYQKAAAHYEKYYLAKPVPSVKQRLHQLYSQLGETEKAEKYK